MYLERAKEKEEPFIKERARLREETSLIERNLLSGEVKMPYFIIELEERVIADGHKGIVIAVGSPHNKSANYLVRLDGVEKSMWFSKDEVVPESYQKEKKGGRWWKLGFKV